MTIELAPDLEASLKQEAERLGLQPAAVVDEWVRERLQQQRNEAALAFLRELREDQPADEAERESRIREWEELKTALDEDRPSDRPLFPNG